MFKSIITAIVLTIVSTVATADGYYNNLAEAVREVATIASATKAECKAQQIHGSYNPGTNVLTMCRGLKRAASASTLKHEAIHLAQDCKAGINNGQVEQLHLNSLIGASEHAHNDLTGYGHAYGSHLYVIELEGNHYEESHFSFNQIIDLVKKYCV